MMLMKEDEGGKVVRHDDVSMADFYLIIDSTCM